MGQHPAQYWPGYGMVTVPGGGSSGLYGLQVGQGGGALPAWPMAMPPMPASGPPVHGVLGVGGPPVMAVAGQPFAPSGGGGAPLGVDRLAAPQQFGGPSGPPAHGEAALSRQAAPLPAGPPAPTTPPPPPTAQQPTASNVAPAGVVLTVPAAGSHRSESAGQHIVVVQTGGVKDPPADMRVKDCDAMAWAVACLKRNVVQWALMQGAHFKGVTSHTDARLFDHITRFFERVGSSSLFAIYGRASEAKREDERMARFWELLDAHGLDQWGQADTDAVTAELQQKGDSVMAYLDRFRWVLYAPGIF